MSDPSPILPRSMPVSKAGINTPRSLSNTFQIVYKPLREHEKKSKKLGYFGGFSYLWGTFFKKFTKPYLVYKPNL
jgi:hypothetical protein